MHNLHHLLRHIPYVILTPEQQEVIYKLEDEAKSEI
jgi:hypothetical protein